MSRGPGFLSGAAFGGLVGAALTMLLAPRSGEETRRRIAAWRVARESSREPQGPLDELLDLGAGALETTVDRFERAREAARLATDEARERLLAEWYRAKNGEGGAGPR